MEYFIVEEGLMWGRVLEILARKAAEGVDVGLCMTEPVSLPCCPMIIPRASESVGNLVQSVCVDFRLFLPAITIRTTER